jgi:hypothetical protein
LLHADDDISDSRRWRYDFAYSNDDIGRQYTRLTGQLSEAERRQRNAKTGDAVGVFLVLLPVSSIFGADNEGDVATLKGQVLSADARISECNAAARESQAARAAGEAAG